MIVETRPTPDITVYDNVFDWHNQQKLYLGCQGAPYKLGWSDLVHGGERYMHSEITSDMYHNFSMLDPTIQSFVNILQQSKPYQKLKTKPINNTIINCDTIADSHHPHTHEGYTVALYYANTEWKNFWGGETRFYDDTGENIVYTSSYTPNRIVVFNGNVLHSFNGPTPQGPKFRFTVSTFFAEMV